MSSREGSPPSQAEAAVMRAGMNPTETSEGGPTASGANLPGVGALGSRRPRVAKKSKEHVEQVKVMRAATAPRRGYSQTKSSGYNQNRGRSSEEEPVRSGQNPSEQIIAPPTAQKEKWICVMANLGVTPIKGGGGGGGMG